MLDFLPFMLQGASLGFSASISPGPLMAYLISQSLAGGWKRGAIVAFAPLLSDIPLVIAVLVLLQKVPAVFLGIISLAGGFYVIYLAWKLYLGRQSDQAGISVNAPRLSQSLLQAVLVNYSSPGPYLFWSLVNGPLLLAALRVSILHAVLFILSFYALFIGCMLLLAGIFSQARRLDPRLVRVLSLISVIILCAFGVILIYRGLSTVL